MANLIEVANSLGKSFKEVENYSDSTVPVTANDLGLDESRAKMITDLGDPPPAPGKPTCVVTGSDIAVSWTAATRATEYQVQYLHSGPAEYTEWIAGLTTTFTDCEDGAWSFRVRGRNAQLVWGDWSPLSDQAFVLGAKKRTRKSTKKVEEQ